MVQIVLQIIIFAYKRINLRHGAVLVAQVFADVHRESTCATAEANALWTVLAAVALPAE